MMDVTIRKEDFEVSYADTEAVRIAAFQKLIEFFVKHESFSGESICQDDNCQIEAPGLLGEIADQIGFEVDWLED